VAYREPQGLWQRWSPPKQEGGVQNREAYDSTETLPRGRTNFGAVGHVVVRHVPCLELKLVCGGTLFAGYQQWPPDPPWER
jgi:hypothetical protein